MVVETLLIVPVASLDLAVMPRCSRTDKFMLNLVTVTEHIKRVNSLDVEEMSKFCVIVRLNYLGSISKEGDCTLYEIYGRVAAVFFISIDKTLS